MAEIIRTNGMRESAQPSNGEDFTLEEMQTVVRGYIELVGLDETNTMVVNEEGKLDGLPFNFEATKMFLLHYPESNDFIVGDVLVCSNEQIK